MVQILLMFEVLFTQDSKVEDLFYAPIKCAIPFSLEINRNFGLVTLSEFSLKYAVCSIFYCSFKLNLKKRKIDREN